mmetsp:Transcript_47139/g.86509  ORF Transcript_47139/g.86509 Transcript_47139/m.86509 type:complete len:381 (-) Transcript_47139:73-1215(-)
MVEPAKAPDAAPSKEDLALALQGREVEELREMGKRLSKSCKDLELLLDDLKVEQQTLQDEKAQLTETIELMMRELKKLNIGADNTVEPVLVSETPIDIAGAVGRLWEKVRPRDNAVVVSEHVGELKKPGSSNSTEEVGAKVAEKLTEGLSAWGNAIGPWWQTAQQNLQSNFQTAQQGLQTAGQNLQTTGVALWSATQEGAAGATASAQSMRSRWMGEGGSPTGGAADGPSPAAAGSQQPEDSLPASAPSQPTPAVAPAPAPATAPPPAAAQPVEASASKPAPAAAPAPVVEASHTEEVVNGTVLVEASITLEDGDVKTLQVRAADRCKEVAARFVKEHSLKAWFVEPLTAYLKKVEGDADEYPVVTQADLAEIRKQYSKA